MPHAIGVLAQTPDPTDQASMRQLLEQEAVLRSSLPHSKDFIVATYNDGSPTVNVIVGTRPKIFTLLGVEGNDDDPRYALISPEQGIVCSNDPRLLKVAQDYERTLSEVKKEMASAS